MKNMRVLAILLVSLLAGCTDPLDFAPLSFTDIKANPDDIYMYAGGAPEGVRLDPIMNDSIKVDVTIAYTSPSAGTIRFIANEGWFYKPNDGFLGRDEFSYTLCNEGKCVSAPIRMFVEPFPANCTAQINAEAVSTSRDTPIEIRVFINDIVCPDTGIGLQAPERGSFKTYSYSGNAKNIVYVYYPPKGFTGIDRFRYRLFTPSGDLQAFCTINVN